MRRNSTPRGFSLVEAMVVVAILGILAAIAMPSFTGTIERYRTEAALDSLIDSVQLARQEGVKRKNGVTITPADTSDWAKGWTIAGQDNAGNAVTIRVQDALPGVAIVRGSAEATPTYNLFGMAGNWQSFTIMSSKDNADSTLAAASSSNNYTNVPSSGSAAYTNSATRILCISIVGQYTVQKSGFGQCQFS